MTNETRTPNQEISTWLDTVGTDAPLQHSNPASLYLASLQGSEASRTTARSVMKQIALLCDHEPDTFPWHRLDRATVLALLEKLKQKGLADNTRNLYLSIIKGVTREAMLHQQMADHQFSLIEQIRAIKLQRLAVGRALHIDEIAKLIDHCLHDEGAAGVRDAALLAILFGCGPRRAEVVTIDINKLNFRDRSIKVIGKGNKERELEMPPRTIDLVKTWLEESGLAFGPLFRPVNRWNQITQDRRLTARGVYDIVTRRVKQAGLDKASPHDLRRSFLTYLLDNGEDLATAADMAGHASADTTRRYLRHQKRRNRAAATKSTSDSNCPPHSAALATCCSGEPKALTATPEGAPMLWSSQRDQTTASARHRAGSALCPLQKSLAPDIPKAPYEHG